MQLQKLLDTVTQPFTSVEYYKKAVHKSLWSSIATLASVVTLMAFVSGFHFLSTQLPVIQNTVQHIITDTTTHYPQELVFNWSGSQLTANTETIVVPWPSESAFHSEALPEQFLYYTNSQQTPTELGYSPNKYLAFVNTTELYRMDNENPEVWTNQKLTDFVGTDNPTTIDRNLVTMLTQTASEYVETHQTQIKATTLFVFILIFLGSKLWFLFIETILAVLLFKLYSIKLTAIQTVILSLHILIPTVVLTTMANLLYQDIPFPIQTLTFWILLLFLSFQFKEKETVE